MPVSQKVHIDTYDYGATLPVPTLNAIANNALVGTADSCGELVVDSGIYVAEFVGAAEVNLIPAGWYRLRTASGGLPLKWFVKFAGVDGELVHARAEMGTELSDATNAQLTAIAATTTANATKLDTLLARIGNFTGTGVNNLLGFLRAMFRSDATLPSDMGGTATALLHSLQAIRVRGDEGWACVEGVEATAEAATAGVITGFPASLHIGASYTTELSNFIRVYIRDTEGDPVTTIGSKTFIDSDFVPELVISSGTTASLVTAVCTWIPAVGPTEGYLKVQLPISQTRRAVEGSATMQLTLMWEGFATVQATQEVIWLARIKRTVQ
jgi:hypothetical protein